MTKHENLGNMLLLRVNFLGNMLLLLVNFLGNMLLLLLTAESVALVFT